MTDDARVYTALSATGLKGTKIAWPLGNAPPLPWFTYQRSRGGEIHADNDNYIEFPRYVAELYIRENDPELVEEFGRAVRTIGPFSRREQWLTSENCMVYRFQFTLTPERGA